MKLLNEMKKISQEEQSLLIRIFASLIWVDDECSVQEIDFVKKVATELNADAEVFVQSLRHELSLLQELSPAVVSSYLKDAASQVSDEYKMSFLQCAVQLVLADQLVSYAEMSVILALASAFELDAEYAMLMLAQCVRDGEHVKVEWDDTVL